MSYILYCLLRVFVIFIVCCELYFVLSAESVCLLVILTVCCELYLVLFAGSYILYCLLRVFVSYLCLVLFAGSSTVYLIFQSGLSTITCLAWKSDFLVFGDVDGTQCLWDLKAKISRFAGIPILTSGADRSYKFIP